MKLYLKRATTDDAQTILNIQHKSFAELLEKYQDYETSPANAKLEKVQNRLRQDFTYYYMIFADEKLAGAIRIIDRKDGSAKRVSPLFVLPEYRGKGIAQWAMQETERIHGEHNWELDTILEEKGNCYLYEKMGYRKTGGSRIINERMTLVDYRKD